MRCSAPPPVSEFSCLISRKFFPRKREYGARRILRLHRIALGLPAFHMHAKLPLASLTFKEANFVGTIQLQNAHQSHRLFTGRARLHIWQRARLSHLASPEHVKRVGSNLNGDVLTVRGACRCCVIWAGSAPLSSRYLSNETRGTRPPPSPRSRSGSPRDRPWPSGTPGRR